MEDDLRRESDTDALQRIVAHTPLSKNEVENKAIWKKKSVVTIASANSVFYRSMY